MFRNGMGQAPKTEPDKDAAAQASERSESYVSTAEHARTQFRGRFAGV
jgi:hypothetical protein